MAELELARGAALRQAAVLWRARGPHVARLVDASSREDGSTRLVVEHGDVPLAEVLARAPTIGEAATILVPLAESMELLAVAGVAHGGIAVDAVRLDARGAPVLGGFESASLLDAGRDVGRETSNADRASFIALAREVLGAVRDEDAAATAAVRAALDEVEVMAPGALAVFVERVLGTAQPEPVRLGGAPKAATSDRPASRPPTLSRASIRQERRPSLGARTQAMVAAVLRGRKLPKVRPKFWVPAVAAVVAVVAALVLVPADAPEAEAGFETPTSSAPQPALGATPIPTPTSAAQPEVDPVAAALRLRRDATDATVIDDFGDVVLLSIRTVRGNEDLLIERTDDGWRLRDTLPTADPQSR